MLQAQRSYGENDPHLKPVASDHHGEKTSYLFSVFCCCGDPNNNFTSQVLSQEYLFKKSLTLRNMTASPKP
jgi:hypothetical protein